MTSAPCHVVRRHLDAFVDGELDVGAQIEFDTHLSGCPRCRDQAAFSRSMKHAVRQAVGTTRAPLHLEGRLRAALAALPSDHEDDFLAPAPRTVVDGPIAAGGLTRSDPAELETSSEPAPATWKVTWLPARYAVPATAAAVLFLFFSARSDNGRHVALEASAAPLFEDVVRRHSADFPTEVAGPPQQLAGWFRGKLEFPARPVEFVAPRARLLGARLSNVREREAAAFYYEIDGHRVTVLVFEQAHDDAGVAAHSSWVGARHVRVSGRELYYRQVRGYTVPLVEHDGLNYAFTGDLDAQAMIQLAATARVAH